MSPAGPPRLAFAGALAGLPLRAPSPRAAAPRAAPRALRHRPLACARPPAGGAPREEEVLALLRAADKGPQQRGLLLARRLAPDARLRALLFSVRESGSEWIRATAAVGMGQLRGADAATRRAAADALLALLAGDRDFSIRSAAAAGCGYLADEEGVAESDRDALAGVVDALIRGWFEDSEWQVRFSCLVSLGCLRDPRAVPVLVEALKSDNDLLVQGAVGACGDLGDDAVVAPLLDCLASDDMMTRQRLAQALGCFPKRSREPAVVDALGALAGDPSFAVREAAKGSLARYGLPIPESAAGGSEPSLSNEERIEREVAAIREGGADADAQRRTEEAAGKAWRRRLERSFDKNAVTSAGTTGDAGGVPEVGDGPGAEGGSGDADGDEEGASGGPSSAR